VPDPASDRDLSPMAPERVPDGYPGSLERWIEVADGRRIFVRPIVPEDVTRLAFAFAHADLDTLSRRFFTAAPPSDPASLAYLATLDYRFRLALLAMDDTGTSIAIGRYEGASDVGGAGVAEVAIVVAPPWRRRGVGRALLCALEHPALDNGFTSLTALYLPSNRAVEALLESIGYGERHVEGGIAVLTKHISAALPSRGCGSSIS
jgi:GNAT superfamily N-acetyltransferase